MPLEGSGGVWRLLETSGRPGAAGGRRARRRAGDPASARRRKDELSMALPRGQIGRFRNGWFGVGAKPGGMGGHGRACRPACVFREPPPGRDKPCCCPSLLPGSAVVSPVLQVPAMSYHGGVQAGTETALIQVRAAALPTSQIALCVVAPVATCATSGALASSRDALRADSDLRAYGPCHRRDGTAGTAELLPQITRQASALSVMTTGPAATCRSMDLAAAAASIVASKISES